MTHDRDPFLPRETVQLEAGLVADIDTGEVRSEALIQHYAIREQKVRTEEDTRRRNAQALAVLALCALSLMAALCFFW